MKQEKGFHFYDFPCASGKPEALIIILHGHGSHPVKYRHLAEKTRDENPQADVLLVRGPIALKATAAQKKAKGVPEVDDLYSWWGIEQKKGQQVKLLLRNVFNRIPVVDRLNRFADHHLKKRGLKTENLAIVGFSMGGGMALHVAAKRKEKVAAVVSHSGMVLPVFKAKTSPDALMIMGDKDELFYLDGGHTHIHKGMSKTMAKVVKLFRRTGLSLSFNHDAAVGRVRNAGFEVSEKLMQGLNHRISEESWAEVNGFVKKRLKK